MLNVRKVLTGNISVATVLITFASPVYSGTLGTYNGLGGNVYEYGFNQVSSVNQNSFITKRDSQNNVLWSLSHASSATDERAVFLTEDTVGTPWAVFTTDGGSLDSGFITQNTNTAPGAFTNVFLNSYGVGGGPKVSIIARLDPLTGKIQKGTFLRARLGSGRTNTLVVSELSVDANGIVTAEGTSFSSPPAANATQNNWVSLDLTGQERNSSGGYDVHFTLPNDLSGLLTAQLGFVSAPPDAEETPGSEETTGSEETAGSPLVEVVDAPEQKTVFEILTAASANNAVVQNLVDSISAVSPETRLQTLQSVAGNRLVPALQNAVQQGNMQRSAIAQRLQGRRWGNIGSASAVDISRLSLQQDGELLQGDRIQAAAEHIMASSHEQHHALRHWMEPHDPSDVAGNSQEVSQS